MQSVAMMKVSRFISFSLSNSLRISFCELSKIRALSTTVSKEKEKSSEAISDVEQQLFLERQEDQEQREHYIEMRRNKSRLYPQHRNVVHDKAPYSDVSVPYDYVQTIRWNRRMYGRYGNASKVDPRIAWPTKEDLKDAAEYESLLCPKTIEQMVQEEKEKIAAKRKAELEQDERIAANISKMDAWKEEIKAKLTKKLLEASVAKTKRAKLIEEVRRHVGFNMDPKDPRFQEVLEAKEKEERKALKEAKKKQRHEEMIAKMLKMAEDDKKQRQEKNKGSETGTEPQKD